LWQREYYLHYPLWITGQVKSPASAFGVCGFFISSLRIHHAFDALFEIKNPSLSQQSFFFVAETCEISNIDLIRDIDRILKLEEV